MILDRYFNDKNIADIDDIQLEIWIRKRNKGEIVWITKDKKEIPIKNLSDEHLQNIYNMMLKKEDLDYVEYRYLQYCEDHDDIY